MIPTKYKTNTEAAFVMNYWGFDTPNILKDVEKGEDVIIVDTNNPAELPCNINNANIIEIIDHHLLIGGLKTNKPGLRKLLKLLLLGRVNKLVLSHKDRLLRFGSNLIFEICDFMGTKVEILNSSEEKSFEVELSEDVISIMTVSCARLYGKRAHMNKKAA